MGWAIHSCDGTAGGAYISAVGNTTIGIHELHLQRFGRQSYNDS